MILRKIRTKQFKNALQGLLPAKMLPVVIGLSDIFTDKKVNEITKEERNRLLHLLKQFPVTLTGLRDFNEAIITKGGVVVKEVNPATMESKLVSGLYFAGEVLDLDALTGGFNLADRMVYRLFGRGQYSIKIVIVLINCNEKYLK